MADGVGSVLRAGVLLVGLASCQHRIETVECGTTAAALDAIVELERRCPVEASLPDLRACVDLARALEGDNLAGVRDLPRAREASRVACAHGVVSECPAPEPTVAPVEAAPPTLVTVVRFATGRVELTHDAEDVLEAVRATLGAHPEIQALALVSHRVPGEAEQVRERRAAKCVDWLVLHGVERSRLQGRADDGACPRHAGQPCVSFRVVR